MSSDTSQSPSGDPFEDSLMRMIVLILIVFALITALAFSVIYLGDSYAVPAWDEHSVPPPSL